MLSDVTAVVVFCCTPELVEPCISKFRRFYPDMGLIIIDNSATGRPEGVECSKMLKELSKHDKKIELLVMKKNIGHGLGLHCGICKVKTDFVYLFESDTMHLRPGLIEGMLDKTDQFTCAVTSLMFCDYNNFSKCSPNDRNLRVVQAPWFYSGLLNINNYSRFPSINSDKGTNANPVKDLSKAIIDTGDADRMLISFDVDNYVQHLGGGTRKKIGIPSLEGYVRLETLLEMGFSL